MANITDWAAPAAKKPGQLPDDELTNFAQSGTQAPQTQAPPMGPVTGGALQAAPPPAAPAAPAPAAGAAPTGGVAPAGGALPAGATDLGNNLVKLANGQTVDRNHPLFQQAMQQQPGTTGAPGTTQAAPGQGANVSAAPTGQPPATINDAFRQSLLTQLNAPVGQVNQAEFAPQAAAFRTAQQRSQERAQSQLAESAALEGTNTSGGAVSDRLGLEQQRGQNEGAFEAQLVGQQFQAQRQQLQQALQMASQYGTQQDQMALQDKLAQLDAAIRNRGLDIQGSLGQGDLNLRGELGRGQLNLGLLQTLQQGQQFGDQLGFNYTSLQNSMNRDAILAALGGG